ncbi:redoxin domain-containing protein [Phenylobacterium sp.]|uniref:redoxin domain-containing protein n=1 Tax=Phenylobacterium sp. TaxID=1871053 RepID=UPI002CE4D126|nr:redoxin domain-containing protein [Phenylobacterium sp.]HLZ73632.1 redoxin domain-containing protein [Phenylobacterium sp.]
MAVYAKLAGLAVAGALLSLSGGAPALTAAAPQRVADFQLSDQHYVGRRLYKMDDDKAVVLVSYAAGDGRFRADAPALAALKAAYGGKGVEFLIVDPRLGDTRAKLAADAAAAGLNIPVLFDYEQLVGESLGLTRSAEILVLDPKGWTVAFRGPVDSPSAKRALDGLVAGQSVSLRPEPARGEAIAYPQKAEAKWAEISYARDVVPIVQAKCVVCHQPGGLGPMQLTTYEQIKGFSPMIREVLQTHRMPPFQPDVTVGHWAPNEGLSSDQLKTLVHWIEAGSPRGAGEDPLANQSFHAPPWKLGTPDVVLALPPVDVPATGVLPYQNPVVATNMSEGRWLKASEFLVTDKKVLHHVTTTLSSPGETGAMIRQEMAAGGIGGQGPGRVINLVPKDMGVWVPANADIHMQTHYTPYGKPTTEATKVGLYFYPKGQEPKYPMRTYGVYGTGITIPAGEEYHPEVAYADIPKDMLVYGLTAHAHVRGGSTQVSILYPDGHEEIVLAVPRYDFNWQCEFYLEKPIMVPAGSRIINRWTYDNSTRNHGNPDPKKDIVFGEQTTDEMLTFFIHYRWIGETVAKPHGDYDQLMAKGQLMGALDSNMDGKLEPSELRGTVGQKLKANFAALDKNHDGVLDAEELAAATVRGPNLVRPKQTASESAGGRPVASN